jgi:membrane protein
MWTLLKDAFLQWWKEDNPFQLSAALAYYTLFSLAPLLIIAIAIAGFFFGREATENQIVNSLQGVIGPQSAQAVQTMIHNANQRGSGLIATLVGLGALLLGATGVFAQLQHSLNAIWKVEPKPGRGVAGVVRDRAASFLMVFGIGVVLFIALAASTVVSALNAYLGAALPGGALWWRGVDFLVSFGVITLLFAMMYKLLPDVTLAWKDVWVGAAITSLLFTIGKVLIGLYLGYSSAASVYGAAGSLIVILLWVYYSALILFFGAKVTAAYAMRYGAGMKPSANAVWAGGASHGARDQRAIAPESQAGRRRADYSSEARP